MSFSMPSRPSLFLIQKLTQPQSLPSSCRTASSLRYTTCFHPQSHSLSSHHGVPITSHPRHNNPTNHRFSHSQPSTHQDPNLILNQARPLELANPSHQSISSVAQNNLKLPPSSLNQPVGLSHQDTLVNSIPPSYTPTSPTTPTTVTATTSSSSEQSHSLPKRETITSAPTLNQQSTAKAPASQIQGTTRRSKPAKQVINLTPKAITHLSTLLDGPTPKLIRIGVKNKGCAGMAYNLDYVDQPGKFDEVVVTQNEQGQEVKVLIDSRALFSIIGSTMDWQESKLGNKFVFDNPNIKEECGCGESFLV